MSRKISFDKEVAIALYKKGFTYKEISENLNININTIKSFFIRNISDELRKKKFRKRPEGFEFIVEGNKVLSIEDRKELMNERIYGLNLNEGISDLSFIKWNRQSYAFPYPAPNSGWCGS